MVVYMHNFIICSKRTSKENNAALPASVAQLQSFNKGKNKVDSVLI
jgi:hypothetical protein